MVGGRQLKVSRRRRLLHWRSAAVRAWRKPLRARAAARRCELERYWAAAGAAPGNYLPEACRGCAVVHHSHPRILGPGPVIAGGLPFRWNGRDGSFAVSNPSSRRSAFTFVSFSGAEALDRHGQPFPTGETRDEVGRVQDVTSFVVVVGPRSSLRLCQVDVDRPGSDVCALPMQSLGPIPRSLMAAFAPGGLEKPAARGGAPLLHFPLGAAQGPFLCTQGVGGRLTHFFPESFHAIDLRCPLRTPVLAVGDGVVKEVSMQHRCGGIHVGNLANWNAVSIELEGGVLAEYVHVRPDSAQVKVGDKVKAGQVLCDSGDIGFAPEPHLHLELHLAAKPEGASLPVVFGAGSTPFVPVAGRWYSASGEVQPPESISGPP